MIVVHDAARPLASAALFGAVVTAVRDGADGAIPGVRPVSDTIKRVGRDAAWLRETLDRGELVAVQTPQAFRADVLRAGPRRASDATDDAALVEAARGQGRGRARRAQNIKITGPEADLAVRRSAAAGPGSVAAMRFGSARVSTCTRSATTRIESLVLGGVVFDGEPGLQGHSDADVVAHACADALLGAAGLGDIGQLFPDTDPQWAGADSIGLVRARSSVGCARTAGRSATSTARRVRTSPLAPRRVEMESRLTEVVGAPVSVKGKHGGEARSDRPRPRASRVSRSPRCSPDDAGQDRGDRRADATRADQPGDRRRRSSRTRAGPRRTPDKDRRSRRRLTAARGRPAHPTADRARSRARG